MTLDEREQLRAALRAPGFDEVRFAAARLADGEFAQWLSAGHHADMQWLSRTAAQRLDLQQVLPGARSVVVLGVNYLPADARAQRQQRWAKYALFSDYHDTIGSGLRAAAAVLEKFSGLHRDEHRVFVDGGPVLERGWATVAGVGWQGKNSMLISRRHGNWLFLSAILTRLEVPPDAPLADVSRPSRADEDALSPTPCGTCTRCLTACPTQAFPRPGWVDARRCISYHTIENRGTIPRELRASFGGRVFGCDVCLDVCPWNHFAQAGRSSLVAAREDVAGISLPELLALDEARFREWFRQSPIKRAKWIGLLRNACVAAGNWHETAEWHFGAGADLGNVARAVERLCRHESAIVRAHAVWALFRLLGAAEAAVRLREARAMESAPEVLDEYRAMGGGDSMIVAGGAASALRAG